MDSAKRTGIAVLTVIVTAPLSWSNAVREEVTARLIPELDELQARLEEEIRERIAKGLRVEVRA